MSRRLAVLVATLLVCSVLGPAAAATDASAADHEIDSCTAIDDPGEYEFVEDVQTDQTGSCIEIQADNVTIDGNGHVLAGPGADSNATGFEIDNRVSDVTIRNVEVAGWERGLDARGSYTLEDAVIRDNDDGLFNDNAIPAHLRNVTVEGNDNGISSTRAGVNGVDVTVRENGNGIFGMDGGNYDLEESRVVDNEGYGIKIEHSSSVTLNNSTVSGNGGHGIYFPRPGKSVTGYVENTTVSDNGGDGIRAASDTHRPIRLIDVTVEGNDGHEVNGAPTDEPLDSADETSSITADGLQVGSSATTAFEEETIRLEPVDRGSLPERENGTAAGDGLNVSGNVSGPVDLELDVDTDDETVDIWRHAGSGWETVTEDRPVTNGSIDATVEDEGLYAPGTNEEEQDDVGDSDGGDGEQDGTEESGSQGDETSPDGEDGEQTDTDGTEDDVPTDTDGEKDKHTPTSTPTDEDDETADEPGDGSCGCPSDSATPDGQDGTETSTADKSTSGEAGTESPASDLQQDDESGDDGAEEEPSDGGSDDAVPADGPGFTGLTAIIALLAVALLAHRRR